MSSFDGSAVVIGYARACVRLSPAGPANELGQPTSIELEGGPFDGAIAVQVQASGDDATRSRLVFGFEIDQSFLPAVAADIGRLFLSGETPACD